MSTCVYRTGCALTGRGLRTFSWRPNGKIFVCPDNAAAEGFFGGMKTEAVYPEKWEEHTRNEVLSPGSARKVAHFGSWPSMAR